jgi:hypothetical protein
MSEEDNAVQPDSASLRQRREPTPREPGTHAGPATGAEQSIASQLAPLLGTERERQRARDRHLASINQPLSWRDLLPGIERLERLSPQVRDILGFVALVALLWVAALVGLHMARGAAERYAPPPSIAPEGLLSALPSSGSPSGVESGAIEPPREEARPNPFEPLPPKPRSTSPRAKSPSAEAPAEDIPLPADLPPPTAPIEAGRAAPQPPKLREAGSITYAGRVVRVLTDGERMVYETAEDTPLDSPEPPTR